MFELKDLVEAMQTIVLHYVEQSINQECDTTMTEEIALPLVCANRQAAIDWMYINGHIVRGDCATAIAMFNMMSTATKSAIDIDENYSPILRNFFSYHE